MATRSRRIGSTLAVAGLVVLAASCSLGPDGEPTEPPRVPPAAGAPNIVFILTDDLSANLVQYMSEVRDMQAHGIDFTNYFVTSPLCCPSRGTLLTGKYPHNTGIESNQWPNGGFGQFIDDQEASLGPYLQAEGYRTGFLGKFLNEYEPIPREEEQVPGAGLPPYEETATTAYVPPGWDEWFVPGRGGYGHFNYLATSSVDSSAGRLEAHDGFAEEDYLTDVLADRATDFVEDAALDEDGQPFFLEVSTFAVHNRNAVRDPEGRPVTFPPAPRDRLRPADPTDWPDDWQTAEFPLGDCGDPVDGGCADVEFPDPTARGSFNRLPTNPPTWMPDGRLPRQRIAELEVEYFDRVRMVQSINDLIRSVRDQLEESGIADQTYLVFSSDNGFHLGEHGLDLGKRTAYDHDARVPLVVLPPGGVDPPVVRSEVVQGTDLVPTFVDLAEGEPPPGIDGRSIVGLLGTAPAPDDWRTGALIEHDRARPVYESRDVDREPGGPPTYLALRTASYLYVEYGIDSAPPQRLDEFYDLRTDPDQLHNVVEELDPADHEALRAAVRSYHDCAGSGCQDAARDLPDPFGQAGSG